MCLIQSSKESKVKKTTITFRVWQSSIIESESIQSIKFGCINNCMNSKQVIHFRVRTWNTTERLSAYNRCIHQAESMKFGSASTVVVIPTDYPQHDLVWSFQSIFISMRFYGIDLDVLRPRSALRRYFFMVLGLLLFIYKCESLIAYVFANPNTWKTETNIDCYWVVYIIIKCILSILFEIAVYTSTAFKWRSLWKKAEEMEHFIQFPTDFYRQLRRVNLTCMVVGFIWVNLLAIG